MNKELIIRSSSDAVDFALLKDGKLIELHKEEENSSGSNFAVGDIFISKIRKPVAGLNAAFVNLARQVFIENEFCLVGFSGDDPNFLQWIGWVRDHLTNHARRIYLVGALNLSAPKRKYLESLNVAPIDLSRLVNHIDNQDEKHL